MAYEPPESNKLPFNFTDKGYEPPTDELLFNFKEPLTAGDLKAAINVLQLHRDEHYVYDTTCPKYVVGYKNGRVQIIKGPCTQHALRDFGATIKGIDISDTTSNITAKIIGLKPDAFLDLPADIYGIPPGNLQGIIGAHDPENLLAEINAIKLKGTGDLGGIIDTHDPGDLQAIIESHDPGGLKGIIKGWQRGIIEDLPAVIEGIYFKGTGDLPAYAGGHLPGDLPAYAGGHLPGNLPGIITGFVSDQKGLSAEILGELFHGQKDLGAFIDTHDPEDLSAYIFGERRPAGNLPAYIWGHEIRDLGAIIDTHQPRNLKAYLDVRQHEHRDLPTYLRGWGYGDLSANINTVVFRNLKASVNIVEPVDLNAYLRVQPSRNLQGIVRAWGYGGLGAQVNITYYRDLPAKITGVDVFNTLRAYIRGVGEEYRDLGAHIHPFHYRDLGGFLQPRYLGDLVGVIYPIAPRDLKGILHGWQEAYLPAFIDAKEYPFNLKASIYPDGKFGDLGAYLDPVQQRYAQGNLGTIIHPWENRFLGGYIYGDHPGNLGAYINPLGYSSDLHASIRPKMIRLTTYIAISTMEHLDLSAIINAACVQSGSANLGAFMFVKYKGDLSAYIRPIQYDYKPALLGATTGYADAYTEVDKYKLRINIKESEYFSEDKYRLLINISATERFLGASITGTYLYKGLSANILPQRLPTFTYDTESHNREKVINKTYDQMLKGYKVVELAFEDMVKDYHYSSTGNYAWKQNQFERWMLSVESFIPASVALNLARKLYKATTVYNFREFKSVDEAIRNAISYVTEQPVGDLGAFVDVIGRYSDLGATIGTRYLVTDNRETLSGSITGYSKPIVIGMPSGVEKI